MPEEKKIENEYYSYILLHIRLTNLCADNRSSTEHDSMSCTGHPSRI